MNKIIITLIVLGVLGYFLFNSPKKEEIKCYSQQCEEDLIWLKNKRYKDWEKYENAIKEAEKPRRIKVASIKDKDFYCDTQMEFTDKGVAQKMFNCDKIQGNISDNFVFYSATGSIPILPKTLDEINEPFENDYIFNKLRDRDLRENKCIFNLICPSLDTDEIIHEKRLYEEIFIN